jgi:transcriptional regulator with XRE-family HTH domain
MAKTTGAETVTGTLREAIQQSGRSLSDIGRATGVGPDRLSRFVRGQRDLYGSAIDALCQALGLVLVRQIRPRPEAAQPKPPRKQ